MSSDEKSKVIFIKESLGRFQSILNRARSLSIVCEIILSCDLIVDWISPDQITEQSLIWDFFKAINLVNVVQALQQR